MLDDASNLEAIALRVADNVAPEAYASGLRSIAACLCGLAWPEAPGDARVHEPCSLSACLIELECDYAYKRAACP
jgi:hypothetical protein